MNKIETYKDVTINERTYRIKKFDARTGSFMLLKVTKLLAPMLKNLDIDKFKDVKDASDVNLNSFNISGIMDEIGNIPERDFSYIQDKCLRVCHEALPAGLTPVLNENGTFGVMGLEDDTVTVLALTAHALIFNLNGFFSGSPLASMAGGLLTTFQRG